MSRWDPLRWIRVGVCRFGLFDLAVRFQSVRAECRGGNLGKLFISNLYRAAAFDGTGTSFKR